VTGIVAGIDLSFWEIVVFMQGSVSMITLSTQAVGAIATVAPSYETYSPQKFTVYLPVFAGLLVLTVILLDESMLIQGGHVAPLLSLQLYAGTIPQPLESVNKIAPVV
jgi:hypothetical protein